MGKNSRIEHTHTHTHTHAYECYRSSIFFQKKSDIIDILNTLQDLRVLFTSFKPESYPLLGQLQI